MIARTQTIISSMIHHTLGADVRSHVFVRFGSMSILLGALALATGACNVPAETDQAAESEAEDQARDEGEVGEAEDGAELTEGGTITDEPHTEDELLTNVRQLILEGKRSGEGYFSPDGRYLIFQAEREPDNPFYQMYLLDLETGDTRRLSPGQGKTTCGWVHPSNERVIFASSHDDPGAADKMQTELDLREKGEQRRYEWAYDDHYEIYSVDLETEEFTNLTNSPGYDAEGSYSPDGSLIAFSSNRLAYGDEPMSEEDQELFEFDNGYMAEIYLMNADGSDIRRLTDTPGYDGGPFFSPDGQRILWRRFNAEGDVAEIYTMNIDGSDETRLTDLGAMSWAPFYHPTGDYIIFSTSVHGFQNFEFYMVDTAGEKDPVRVTFTDGPDVLPVFNPAGDQLVWSTRRGADGLPQVHIADWNDARARELLALSPQRGSTVYDVGDALDTAADLSATAPEIRPEDARLHVERLTDESMDGRLTGTPGEAAATAYVADAFERLGLEPAGEDGFFQAFDFTSGVSLEGPNVLSVQFGEPEESESDTDEAEEMPDPELDTDWRPLSFSKAGSVGFSDVIFAGYGIKAPKESDQPAYDSYGELDVDGKWVVALRYLPEDITPERRQHLSRYASLRFKAMEARDRGAAGILIVSGPNSQTRDQLVPLRFDASVSGAAIPAVSITDELAGQFFEAAGLDLGQAQTALDEGEMVPGFELPGAQVGAHFSLTFEESVGRNVVGRLVVGEEASEQVVVIGAHVDHLGHGEGGDSLALSEEEGQIHAGADDNASGVAGLIEIAQKLSARDAAGELDEDQRDFVFVAWSGEELGLLGSNHYVKAMKAQMDDAATIYPAVSAYLNMDMIGRLEQSLVLQGIGSSSFWTTEIEKRNVPVGLSLSLSQDTYLPTDATSFYLAGVPILSAFTGAHSEYHSPRDTADTLDYEDLAKVAKLVGLIAQGVATADEPPEYVEIAPEGQGSNRRTGRAYLGTIPDYAETDVQGVMLSGVANESPAAEAGILTGDILVMLAGQEMANIYDFVRVLDALKIGETVEAAVMRDGERIEVTVTPVSRD